MSFQWLKKKPKGSESRKEKSKVNDKIQKLISDIKSKRESMASVQTGFPSSVASFVTNTWMPSHDDDIPAKKKKRWPYTRKKAAQSKESQSEKAETTPPDEVRGPPTDPQSVEHLYKDASTETQSLRHFSTNPQSEDEISEQICSDHEGVGEVGSDPQFVGQIRNDPHGQFGCEPNDPRCRGNEPQSVGMTLEQNSKDQGGKDVSSLGQLCISEGPPRFCPLCGELLAVVVILAVSISVVLDAKKAALGLTAIVYFVLRVFFRKQETLSRTNIVSIWSSICKEVRNICQNICFLKNKNRIRSEALSLKDISLKDKVGVLPSFAEGVQCDRSKFGINRELKKRKALVKKSGLGMKPSSALGSSLLIVVLVGLMAGRLPAFVLVLAWCLLVKLVQTAEERTEINAFNKVKK